MGTKKAITKAPAKRKTAKAKPKATKASTGAKTTQGKTTRSATKKGTRAKQTATVGKMSLLDAAVEILGKASEPMTTKAIVAAVIDRGLWSTNGKTPEATLYSAMLREISKKGAGARFERTGRGAFALRT